MYIATRADQTNKSNYEILQVNLLTTHMYSMLRDSLKNVIKYEGHFSIVNTSIC